ncbi:hypothetical protein BCR34DRAFT_42841 [Clohesyomyces aquaticus]|uniref:Small secreted protein n=1 Tax=Clohesyomyces aquaticus TaxID=1231657 RepID=A0A1Y1Z6D6_9PLEO|nr:hypothetical protein BCR34DRAFT_42841 [Clohesyomyces aquaticus]
MLYFAPLVALLGLSATTSATLNPATSNTRGKYPVMIACSPAKASKAIQAAECSHNTRVSSNQTFAVFITDHGYDKAHGAPYGTCVAYTCAPGRGMAKDPDYWTFFWGNGGEKKGEGVGCIRSPVDGTCGCETSSGRFVYGASDCDFEIEW